MRSRVVHDLAPLVVWGARCLRSSEATIDAVVTASEEDDAGELVLKGQIVDNESVQLETPIEGR
jgi:hypothetical protein